jgi:hypothetical protein
MVKRLYVGHRPVELDQRAGILRRRRISVGRRVGTVAELADTLADAQRHPDRLTVVQAVVPAMDVPPLPATMARSLSATPTPR